MEFNPNHPEITVISRPIVDDQGDSTVYLGLIQYENAIQASLYDKNPKLGSMTLAYPVMDRVERQTIIAGKHEQLSAALGLLMVRNTKKIVYASVNLSEYANVTSETIKQMISEFLDQIGSNQNQVNQK